MALQQEVVISAKDVTGAGFKSATGEVKRMQSAINGMSSSVNEKLQGTEKAFDGLGSKMSGLINPTTIAIGAISALTAGFGVLGASVIKTAAQYEQTRIAFETMLGSAELGQKFLAELSNFAATTPFEIPQVEQNAKQLLAMGFAVNEVIPTLTSLGNVAAGLSVPLEQVALAYGQVRAANQLYGSELRQFVQAGIPIIAQLAEQFNKTEGEIKKMVEQGKISFKDVEKAFQSMSGEGGKFENLMAKQSKSVSGLWSNMKDQMTLIARQLGTPLLEPMAKGLEWINEKLKNFRTGGVSTFSKMFSSILSNLGAAMASMKKGWSVIWSVIGPTVIQTWNGLRAAWQGTVATFKLALVFFQKMWENWGNTITAVVKFLWTNITFYFRQGAIILQGIGEIITSIMTGQWGNAGNAALRLVGNMWNNIIDLFNQGVQMVIGVMNDLIGAMNQIGVGIDPIVFNLDRFKTSLSSAGIETKNATQSVDSLMSSLNAGKGEVEAFGGSIDNTLGGMGGAMESAAGSSEKAVNDIEKDMKELDGTLQDSLKQYRDWKDDIKKSLADLEQEHIDKLASITDKIGSLNDELSSLIEGQMQDMADLNLSRAEEIIKQEERIADIREQITAEVLSLSEDEQDALAKKMDLENKLLLLKQKQSEFTAATKESTKLGLSQSIADIEEQLKNIGSGEISSSRLIQLQDELAKEETALANFNATAVGLEDSLTEARRRASLTDFEKFMEDQAAKQEELTGAFNLRKAQIEEELAVLADAAIQEDIIYAQKREQYLKTEKALDLFRISVVTTFQTMKDSASEAVDAINKKLAEMETALARMADIQSTIGTGNTTESTNKVKGFAKGGRVEGGEVIMVGEQGAELFVPSTSGNIIPNNQLQGGQVININITGDYHISKEVDSQKVQRDIQQSIVRALQLSKQGVPTYF